MDVEPFVEGFHHGLILTDGSDDPQLDLRVIGGQHGVFLIPRHKGLPYFPAPVGADRNVLQVGIVRAQPAGGGDSLVV